MDQKRAKTDEKNDAQGVGENVLLVFFAKGRQKGDKDQSSAGTKDSGDRACGQSSNKIPSDPQSNHSYAIGCHISINLFNPISIRWGECPRCHRNIDGGKGVWHDGRKSKTYRNSKIHARGTGDRVDCCNTDYRRCLRCACGVDPERESGVGDHGIWRDGDTFGGFLCRRGSILQDDYASKNACVHSFGRNLPLLADDDYGIDVRREI